MAIRLRKSISSITAAIIFVLICLLFLGYQHYTLQKGYEVLLGQSEKMVTEYTAIREQTIHALISGARDQLALNGEALTAFQSEFAKVVESPQIPEEYRITFLNRLELPGTIMLLQHVSREGVTIDAANEINEKMHLALSRLTLLDRVVINHSKRKLTGFQYIVTGSLAMVLFFIVMLLAMGHRTVIIPLVELFRQVREVSSGSRKSLSLSEKWVANEVTDLGRSFQQLLQQQSQESGNLLRRNEILYSVHRAGLACTKAESPNELFEKVCDALLFGKNYCMVAISVPDREGNSLTPAMTNGVPAIMERNPGKHCLAFLLSEAKSQGEKLESSLRALRQGKPVVDFDILAGIPEGHLTGTTLEDGYAACISVPLIWKQNILGVITLYSTMRDSFAGEEISLLDKMANDMAFALHFLRIKNEESRQEKINSLLQQVAGAGIVTIGPDGVVLAAHPASQSVLGREPERVIGESWFDLAVPEERSELRERFRQFLEHAKENPEKDGAMSIASARGGKRRSLRYFYHYQEDIAREKDSVLCLIIDITEQQTLSSALAANQARHGCLFDALPGIVAVVSPEGAILEMNAPGRRAFGMEQGDEKENNLLDLLRQHKSKGKVRLLEFALQKKEPASLMARLDNPPGHYRLTVAPLSSMPGEREQLLFIASDMNGETENLTDSSCPMQVAALIEIAVNVANEINNLSNGIINYAQLLLDGSREGAWREEQVALLQRIISEGERSAVTVRKLFGPSPVKRKDSFAPQLSNFPKTAAPH